MNKTEIIILCYVICFIITYIVIRASIRNEEKESYTWEEVGLAFFLSGIWPITWFGVLIWAICEAGSYIGKKIPNKPPKWL